MIRGANWSCEAGRYISVVKGDVSLPLSSKASQSQNQIGAEETDEGEMTRENSKPAAFKAQAAVLGPRLAPEWVS